MVVLELHPALVVLAVVVVVLLLPVELVLLVVLTLAAVRVEAIGQEGLAAQAAPALSSCPTPCQKAQRLNSCLLQHGQHQQAFLPLIIWW
jgi:hypothetical protein